MHPNFTTKTGFAASGIAQGLIGNGLSFFLLLYYSQVMGLQPVLASLALFIALIVDAISDPIIGYWSDRSRFKLGRRHPFLIVSIVPITLAYYLLWDPPELEQTGMFIYLLVLIITVRLSLTAHVIPFNALLPEIAKHYDDRTTLMSYSYSASWLLGTLMAVAMYSVWLADTPEFPDGAGILRADGYVEAAIVSAIGIFFCLAWSIRSTWNYIPDLAAAPPASESLSSLCAEALATLNDRNFLAVAISGVFGAAATGTATALWAYMQPYYWGFDTEQTSMILGVQLLAPIAAFTLLPLISHGQEKKILLILLSLISAAVATGPVFLDLAGTFPAYGTNLRFYVMAAAGVMLVTLLVMTGALTASILADIVDARAVATGRREEGLLFSIQSFTGKAATGIGIWSAGLILAVIDFPAETYAIDISQEVISQLAWLYGPVLLVFYLVSIYALTFYHLDRNIHAANLNSLETTQ